jgi:iron complex outermembrane receptor protein
VVELAAVAVFQEPAASPRAGRDARMLIGIGYRNRSGGHSWSAAKQAFFALLLTMFCTISARPQASTNLGDRSLEDLMNIAVTSVSKTEETLSRTASAVFVINEDSIRNSGATNIPDLLRMVPGMDVAQINANTWAISARGLNDRFSNELLVMIDGRTAYTQTFGGVYWDVLDLPLEDIERIEVIRGPGGSIWGANATNGVINIITRKASETQKALIVGGGGNLDQGFGTLQYGGRMGGSANYRVYAKYFDQGRLPDATGGNANDAWSAFRSGFRLDTSLSAKDTLSVQGDLYDGREDSDEGFLPSITSPGTQLRETQVDVSGGFVQGIWNHVASPRSDTSLHVSYDHYRRTDQLGETRNTLNLDFQHHYLWAQRQSIVWGLGFRYSVSNAPGSLFIALNPARIDDELYGFFVQDEIALVKNRLYLTAGTKVEHDDYTGVNPIPSVRVAWTLNKQHMLWAALSRTIRTPSDTDVAVRLNFGGFQAADGTFVVASLFGNPHFKPEGSIAWEMGYRTTVVRHVSIDLSTYYNSYNNQQTTEPEAPFFETVPTPPHLVLPVTYENLMHGETHGLEISANWKVTNRWMLSSGYAFEQIHMHLDPTSQDTEAVSEADGSAPVHSAQIRSHVALPHSLAWDASAYFTGRLGESQVPSYTRLDTLLTWQWREGLSVSLVGQNLLQGEHLEFIDSNGSVQSALIKRSGYAKFTWHF